MIKKLGITILEAKTRAEILNLVTEKSHEEIAKEFNISAGEFSIIASKKIKRNKHQSKHDKIILGMMSHQEYEECPFTIKAFSDNEMDYGKFKNTKHRVTKKGLLIYENSPLKQKQTPFMLASEDYKSMLNKIYERSL